MPQSEIPLPTLNVLAPTRYPWSFNGPRSSRHNIHKRSFVPLNKISRKIEGITFFNPFPAEHFNLIHAFNRIPLARTPFIIGFESHLPRAFGFEKSVLFRAMSNTLASSRCKRVIAISEYAKRQFLKQHVNSVHYDALRTKLHVRLPNLCVEETHEKFDFDRSSPIRLVFVGNHFGRKGGSVVVRLAKMALAIGARIEVEVVSTLDVGPSSWVGPRRSGYWEDSLRLLKTLPNVRHFSRLTNESVLHLIKGAHFTILPTLSDSFGYSTIEGMAHGTPAVVTRQCATPEFVDDDRSGILLDLPVDEFGEWIHINYPDRTTKSYEELFTFEVERMATQALERVLHATKNHDEYLRMREQARRTALLKFSAVEASTYWDDLYNFVV